MIYSWLPNKMAAFSLPVNKYSESI